MAKLTYPKKHVAKPLRTFSAIKNRIRDNRATSQARILWLTIDTYADNKGENAFPSASTLAKHLGWDRKTVFKHLSELEQLGWLARHHFHGQSSSYVLIYSDKAVPKNGTGVVPKNGTLVYVLYQDTAPAAIAVTK